VAATWAEAASSIRLGRSRGLPVSWLSACRSRTSVVAEKIARLCDQPPTFRNPFEAVSVEQV
jgi:hypothetical protein